MTSPIIARGIAAPPSSERVSDARPFLRVRRVEGPPVVALRLWLWGGSRVEDVPGLAWVTGRMLSEGTGTRDWRVIAEACESVGMVLSSYGGLEAHGVGLDCLTRDWRTALEWLAELVFDPAFPLDRCVWQRRQGSAELESLRDEPDSKAAWAFSKHLYGTHAAGRPLPGSAAGLARVDPAVCRVFHRGALDRGGVLTIAGDVDEDEVAAVAGSRFDDVAGAGVAGPAVLAPAGLGARRRRIKTTSRDQAHLFLGHLTVARTDPDVPALEVASVVLGSGAGLTGRIPGRIREREGLAYSAFASAVVGASLDAGRLLMHVGTSIDTVARAESAAREELVRFIDDGLTPSEFEDARTYLLRREPFRRETPQQWADLLAQSALYGLPYDDPEWVKNSYRSLDRATVEAAIRRHLDPDRVKVTIGVPRGDGAEKNEVEKSELDD
ncbi:MAG TPA: pitrilysin family protein [Thermoanaerobaculia bacterium]|jgi:zinc protease|nr:pitrilysin family protein [Thermoanaerobaculia bacterium]